MRWRRIFDGQITQWSNLAIIINTNGGLSSTTGKALQALYTSNSPTDTIKVIYRSASSGTTYAFTDWLHASGGSTHTRAAIRWKAVVTPGTPRTSWERRTTRPWRPISTRIPDSIGYIEYSYLLIPGNAAIQSASLQDREGQWLQPTLTNIAASRRSGRDEHYTRQLLDRQPGRQQCLAARDLSWAIVLKNQTDEATGEAIVKYLDWETHYAQSALAKAEGYVPLPAAVAAYSRQQLMNVTSGGRSCSPRRRKYNELLIKRITDKER